MTNDILRRFALSAAMLIATPSLVWMPMRVWSAEPTESRGPGVGLESGNQLLQRARSAQKAREFRDVLALYEQALAAFEKTVGPNHVAVALTLNDLAGLYRSMGEYGKALPLIQRSLAIRESVLGAEHQFVAISLNNLASLYTSMGELQKVLPLLQRSHAVWEKVLGAEHPNVATSLNNLATYYGRTGDYANALWFFQKSLAIREKRLGRGHPDTAQSLQNLANVYQLLGAPAEALPLSNRSLAIREAAFGTEHRDVAASLASLGGVFYSLRQHGKALPLYQRSLEISERTLGPEHPELARVLGNLSLLHESLREYGSALPLRQRSLVIREKALGPEHPQVAQALASLARLRASMGADAEVIPLYKRAMQIAAQRDNPETLWRSQAGLRIVYSRQGSTNLAIFYGKQAVNTLQGMRARLSGLDASLQRSFLEHKTDVYRGLADLLIEQGRVAEAQQVLNMLKEEEFFDFLRRSDSDDPRQRRVEFLPHEREWHERLQQVTARLGKLGAEQTELERKVKFGLASEAEKTRLSSLGGEKTAAAAELERFYREVNEAFAQVKRPEGESADALANLSAFQKTLSALGTGTIAIHYVQAENRLNLILTTPSTQIARSAPIPSAELNRKIEAFRRALSRPGMNPLPLAQELYQLLIAPVEQELAAAGARTLMLSLDGTLRYIPMAALHDGKGYLVERYDLALYTEVARESLNHRPDGARSIAGLGLTRRIEEFDPLPAVRGELEAIVKGGGSGGIIPGELHFDEQFTAASMRQALEKRHPLVHIASHFVFRPGNESTSFLLLGDGDRLTLSRIREERLDFKHVDLITLSACETGVGGGSNAQGEEIEGLGVLVQKQGAKGVVATLWPVADESTGLLMQNFYRLRDAGKLSKAAALRQAQLMLIRGNHAAGASDAQRGLKAAQPDAAQSPQAARYAHPFFWAPFILMGNWL